VELYIYIYPQSVRGAREGDDAECTRDPVTRRHRQARARVGIQGAPPPPVVISIISIMMMSGVILIIVVIIVILVVKGTAGNSRCAPV
jgi:hypothetical protein